MQIKRNDKITISEIGEIRKSVGWGTDFLRYEKGMKNAYTTFSIRDQKNNLVGFAWVISDGARYALINDLILIPKLQHKKLGTRFLKHIVSELKKEGIQIAEVTFSPELKPLYNKCGFKIVGGGIAELNKTYLPLSRVSKKFYGIK